MPMKTLCVMLRSNAEHWAALLRAALPGHIVVTAATAPGDIAYAVVGKPPPGALAALAGLEVVFSVNAGIEALLESGEVPARVPIVRMVDEGLAQGMLEWVLATTLAWHRNLFAYRDRQSNGQWDPLQEILARDRRVTVLGAGPPRRPRGAGGSRTWGSRHPCLEPLGANRFRESIAAAAPRVWTAPWTAVKF